MMTSTTRRHLLRTLAACAASTTALPLLAEEFEETAWESLVPSDWDPLKDFRDLQRYSAVSDNDPRVQALYERMRKVWDAAPTIATLEGKKVKIPGYIVPLESSDKGLSEFLLVPYFGACIHTPPPPANQIIHVRIQPPVQGFQSMSAVWVKGTLGLERTDSDLGVSGYTITAAKVEKYRAKKK